MEYILETSNLTKVYGHKEAAKDVNLHIKEGQIYGLIGRNGAGKTTIMRMISVEFKPDGLWAQVTENNNGGLMGIINNLPKDEASLNALVEEMNELNNMQGVN